VSTKIGNTEEPPAYSSSEISKDKMEDRPEMSGEKSAI